MKHFILFLLCMGACLNITAAAPRLNKANLAKLSNLTHVKNIQNSQFGQNMTMMRIEEANNDFASPRDFFKAHGLTPADNRLSRKAPRRISEDNVLNTDYLDFRYVYRLNDDGTGLEPSDYFYRGGLGVYFETFDNQLYCAGLFFDENRGEMYYLPIDIDYSTNEVWLPTGFVIHDDTISSKTEDSNPTSYTDTITYTYMVDSDWWLGNSETFSDVPGVIYEDGTIVFDDQLGYVYAGFETVNTYKRTGNPFTGYTYNLESSDTTYFEELYFNTQFIAANALQQYQVDDGSNHHQFNSAYMFQYDATTAVIFNLYGLGMPGVEMNIYPDGTMKYSLDQPLGEVGPYFRKMYQDYFGDEYNWDYVRWYWPIALDENNVETEDSVIIGTVEPTTLKWGPMEYFLPGIIRNSDGQYMAMTSYPLINNELTFTDGSEFILDDAVVVLGDVNNDGVVSLQDVVILIDHILSDDLDDCDDFIGDASDINMDGEISITDVVMLIDIVLGGE